MSKTAYPFIWTECSEEQHEGNTVFVMLVSWINLTNIPCHYEFAMYLVVVKSYQIGSKIHCRFDFI